MVVSRLRHPRRKMKTSAYNEIKVSVCTVRLGPISERGGSNQAVHYSAKKYLTVTLIDPRNTLYITAG